MKLVEVKIYQPAKKDGLFPHPRQTRFANFWDVDQHRTEFDDEGNPICLRLLIMSEWRGYFDEQGKGSLFCGDSDCRAEIVGEIDEARAMEADRIVEGWV